MSDKEERVDVIVVGAGISGLHAARCLTEEGLNVKVLEARDHPGGRAWTYRAPKSDKYADMGGAYFGRHQTKAITLAKDLGLQLYKVPLKENSLLYFDGKSYRYVADELPFTIPFSVMDLNTIFKTLDAYSREVPLDKPWTAKRAKEWDSMTIEDFAKKNCWTETSKKLVCFAFNAIFGGDPAEISFLFTLKIIRSCGGSRALTGSNHGLQELKIVGGSNSISEKLADRLKGKVLYNSVVCKVEEDSSSKYVCVHTSSGKTFTAANVVIAMPPPVLKNLEFVPTLPELHQAYIEHCPTGHAYKTIMYYNKPYWLEKGLNGEMVSDQIVGYTLPDTKPDGKYPAIMGFIDPKSHLLNKTKDERKVAIAEHYATAWGIQELSNPIDYLEKNWNDEEGSKYSGVCVYSLPPKFLTKHKGSWGQTHGRVHFAGAEATDIFHGYMDGALRSAERVTKEIVESSGHTLKKLDYTEDKDIPYKPTKPIEVMLPSITQLLLFLAVIILLALWTYLQTFDVSLDSSGAEDSWNINYPPSDSKPTGVVDDDFNGIDDDL